MHGKRNTSNTTERQHRKYHTYKATITPHLCHFTWHVHLVVVNSTCLISAQLMQWNGNAIPIQYSVRSWVRSTVTYALAHTVGTTQLRNVIINGSTE